ncbi:MAG: HupE/UreJ family protein [Chthoniobacterales bacterium]
MKWCLTMLALWGGVAAALAHPVAQGAMELHAHADKVLLRVRVAPEEVFVANMHAAEPAATLEEAYARHGEYLLQHMRLRADEQALRGTLVHAAPPQAGEHNAQAVYDYAFPVSRLPHSLSLEQDILNEFDYVPGNRWEASYIVRAQIGGTIVADGALLTSATPLNLSANNRPSAWRTMRDYFAHGIGHILTGYDHLLFISALALAVISFWELARVIAAFTLAHTVTLTLSVIDLVRLPSHIVEPMIAASIVCVALQNVFWPRTSHGGPRLAIAFIFGLFHGLGFAGGLLDAMSGLPGLGIGLAIVAFSCGVEIGHQCVVLPVFGLTKLVRGRNSTTAAHARGWLLRGGSAIIAAAGMFYLVAALTQNHGLR